jgi:hypothetical protein
MPGLAISVTPCLAPKNPKDQPAGGAGQPHDLGTYPTTSKDAAINISHQGNYMAGLTKRSTKIPMCQIFAKILYVTDIYPRISDLMCVKF